MNNTDLSVKAALSVTFDLLILVSIFQKHSKITKIQVNILPIS